MATGLVRAVPRRGGPIFARKRSLTGGRGRGGGHHRDDVMVWSAMKRGTAAGPIAGFGKLLASL
jgi:hypothetical protein